MRGLVRIATSISSSAATFCSMMPAVAYSILSLCPEAASKAGARSCRTARIAPALSTLSSAALASAANTPVNRANVPASNRMVRIIATPLQVLHRKTTDCHRSSGLCQELLLVDERPIRVGAQEVLSQDLREPLHIAMLYRMDGVA